MATSNTSAPSPRIFVVDDDTDIRAIVVSALGALSDNIEEFADGASVLSACENGLPAVMVLDVMMPGMDGNQVCKKLRDIPGGEYVQIIMLTARDSLQDKIDSLDGGADDYLTKPFNYQELAARVKALLRVHELSHKLIEKNSELESAKEKIVAQQRQLAVVELAGAAAHELGQPLSAILLNCHLLGKLSPEEKDYKSALAAVVSDAKKMSQIVESMKTANAERKSSYHGKNNILNLSDEDS